MIFFLFQFCFYSAFPNIVLLIVILNLHFDPYVNKVSKEIVFFLFFFWACVCVMSLF